MNNNIITVLKKFNLLLDFKHRKNLILLFLLKVYSGFMDMIGVASIAPVILVLTKRELLDENKYILKIKNFTNFDNDQLVIFFVLISLILIVLNISIRGFNVWCNTYLLNKIWLSVVTKVFKYYLNRPYIYHLNTTSNQLLERITIRVNDGVYQIISSIYLILGSIFSIIFLSILLFIIDYKITIILTLVITTFYLFVYLNVRRKIDEYGVFVPQYSRNSFKLVDQALRSIKDIMVSNNYSFYTDRFFDLQKKYTKQTAKMVLFNQMPRNLIEMLAFLLIYSLIFFFLIFESQKINEVALILGIFAVAFQRMIPAYQGIYQGLSNYKAAIPTFHIIYQDLLDATKEHEVSKKNNTSYERDIFTFQNKVEIKNISFSYAKSQEKVLQIHDLKLKAGNFIGITGLSGAGKSTFVDILIGLLKPNEGEIFIDEKKMDEKIIKDWKSIISYIPQFSFIADDTIKNNIALGLEEEKINLEKIKKSCDMAQLKDFIEEKLPQKFETKIGENGVRVSGGQRQRISIARAIYKNTQIIILDEATNSIDNITEEKIIDKIRNEFKNKTIIMITHRISTLKNCDQILFFHNGKLNSEGSYEDLIKNDLNFKELEQKIVYDKEKNQNA